MLVKYRKEYEDSLIRSYIETFSEEPWNDVWDYDWVLNRIRWVAEVPNFTGIVAIEDERVVGALLGYAKPFREKLDFEILELFVVPSYQGKGLGKLLVRELEDSLPTDQYGVVHLLTAKDTDSEEFYKKLGYVRNNKLCFMVHRR